MDDPNPSPPQDQAGPSSTPAEPTDVAPAVAEQVRGLLRFLYTNNPFYAISAGLVFWGLRSSFDTTGESFETGALMIGLTGYTALLAASACVLIRVGQVWDDVRSILVLVVLMFLATSVSFDDALAANPRVGVPLFLGGLLFAVLVSEGLLRGIRLSLPAWLRVPYYLILALFFLYPAALGGLIRHPSSPALHWALFGFSPVAGVAFLALLPAVRRGPDYVRDHGSPWSWPWYPWVLFGVLGLGVCGRAYYLCMSLHFVGGTATIFGPYFLVPFLLALNVLLLEMGLVSRSTAVTRLALVAPFGLLALAVTGPSAKAADHGFLEMFMGTLGGSPLFCTLIAISAFHAVALLRRIPHAFDALCASLAVFTVCGASTVDPATLAAPRGVPLWVVAALHLWVALRRRSTPRGLVAVCLILAAATLDARGTTFTAHGGLIPLHLLLGALLLIGAISGDWFGRLMQHLGAVLILLFGVAAVTIEPRLLGNPPPLLLTVYPALAVATAAAYGWLVGNRWHFASALGTAAGWAAVSAWHGYRHLRQAIVGLDYLLWGLVFFLLALLISLTKAGLLQRWLGGRRRDGG